MTAAAAAASETRQLLARSGFLLLLLPARAALERLRRSRRRHRRRLRRRLRLGRSCGLDCLDKGSAFLEQRVARLEMIFQVLKAERQGRHQGPGRQSARVQHVQQVGARFCPRCKLGLTLGQTLEKLRLVDSQLLGAVQDSLCASGCWGQQGHSLSRPLLLPSVEAAGSSSVLGFLLGQRAPSWPEALRPQASAAPPARQGRDRGRRLQQQHPPEWLCACHRISALGGSALSP